MALYGLSFCMRTFYIEKDGSKKEYTSNTPWYKPALTKKADTKPQEKEPQFVKGMRTGVPEIVGDLYRQTIQCDNQSFQKFKNEYLKAYPKECYNTKFIQGMKWGKTREYTILRDAKPTYVSEGVFASPNIDKQEDYKFLHK